MRQMDNPKEDPKVSEIDMHQDQRKYIITDYYVTILEHKVNTG